MTRQTLLSTVLVTAFLIGCVSNRVAIAESEHAVFDYTTVFPEAEPAAPIAGASSANLADIAGWLAEAFHLPPPRNLPKVTVEPHARMQALRNGPFVAEMPEGPAGAGNGSDIVALYSKDTETIHLLQGWTAASPADVSVLIHEMVHHLQHQAKLKYACSEERERVAYAAQERWLARFGLTLENAFGIDPFTLLVRTRYLS